MLRKLVFALFAVVIAGSVWASAVAADQEQGPLSDGCTTLNTLVPDRQRDIYYNYFEVFDLDFFPGETIHVSTTFDALPSTDPVPPGSPPPVVAYGYLGVRNSLGHLLASKTEYTLHGEQTVSFDYVVVAGDDADTVFVESGSNTEYFVYSVNLSCTPANTPPAANNDGYSTPEDATLSVVAPGVLGNDSDGESDLLTAVLVSGPSNGSLTLNADGSFSYTPNTNFSGSDSFTYLANDGTADSNVATVNITVVSAANQITQLAADVQALVNGGALSSSHGQALTNKLDSAQKQLEKGNISAAINKLQEFISQVNNFIANGELTPTQGQPLIDAANAIINSLN